MNQSELNKLCRIAGLIPHWSFKPNGRGGGVSVISITRGDLRVYGRSASGTDARAAKNKTAQKAWLKLIQAGAQALPVTYHAIEKFRETVPEAGDLPDDQIEVLIRVVYLVAKPYKLSGPISQYKRQKYEAEASYRVHQAIEITHTDEVIISVHFSDKWQQRVKLSLRDIRQEGET